MNRRELLRATAGALVAGAAGTTGCGDDGEYTEADARLLAERILGREGELPLFPLERLLGERQAAAGLARVS